ncbi:hypothetical protein PMAYCL1PPCAC_26186, partial [Pristionchus mayeri]
RAYDLHNYRGLKSYGDDEICKNWKLIASPHTESTTTLVLYRDNATDHILWNACLKNCLETIKCPYISTIEGVKIESIKVYNDDVEDVLNFLRPLAQQCVFRRVQFNNAKPCIVTACSDFFKPSSISSIQFEKYVSENNFDVWLNFARKIRASHVKYVPIYAEN